MIDIVVVAVVDVVIVDMLVLLNLFLVRVFCRPLFSFYRPALCVAPHGVSYIYSLLTGRAVHPELYRQDF